MSDEIPTPKAPGFLKKKVAGVPVIYLLAAGVLVLAIVAYRLRNDSANTDPDPAATAVTTDDTADATTDSLTDGGTVPTFAANPVPTYADSTSSDDNTTGNTTIDTNDQWLKKSVEYFVAQGDSAGTVTAALQKYLNGDQLSFDEGAIRDKAVRQFGLPPDGFAQGGTSAQVKKVTTFPGTHTVQGTTDNTYHKLAGLYFTDNDQWFDALQAANVSKLGNTDGPFPVGTKVTIPAFASVRYYTTTKSTNTATEVAKKNGISSAQLNTLNDGVHSPYPVGTKLRVR
jgi:LysM repeat protein